MLRSAVPPLQRRPKQRRLPAPLAAPPLADGSDGAASGAKEARSGRLATATPEVLIRRCCGCRRPQRGC
eukprot:38698-Chlamydomonas_euryale.AAC.2